MNILNEAEKYARTHQVFSLFYQHTDFKIMVTPESVLEFKFTLNGRGYTSKAKLQDTEDLTVLHNAIDKAGTIFKEYKTVVIQYAEKLEANKIKEQEAKELSVQVKKEKDDKYRIRALPYFKRDCKYLLDKYEVIADKFVADNKTITRTKLLKELDGLEAPVFDNTEPIFYVSNRGYKFIFKDFNSLQGLLKQLRQRFTTKIRWNKRNLERNPRLKALPYHMRDCIYLLEKYEVQTPMYMKHQKVITRGKLIRELEGLAAPLVDSDKPHTFISYRGYQFTFKNYQSIRDVLAKLKQRETTKQRWKKRKADRKARNAISNPKNLPLAMLKRMEGKV